MEPAQTGAKARAEVLPHERPAPRLVVVEQRRVRRARAAVGPEEPVAEPAMARTVRPALGAAERRGRRLDVRDRQRAAVSTRHVLQHELDVTVGRVRRAHEPWSGETELGGQAAPIDERLTPPVVPVLRVRGRGPVLRRGAAARQQLADDAGVAPDTRRHAVERVVGQRRPAHRADDRTRQCSHADGTVAREGLHRIVSGQVRSA
jgi:hypothetical protein